jgi:hypothetical protein
MADPLHSSDGNSFPGVKQGQLEANHTRAFSAMVQNEWSWILSIELHPDAVHKHRVTNLVRSPFVPPNQNTVICCISAECDWLLAASVQSVTDCLLHQCSVWLIACCISAECNWLLAIATVHNVPINLKGISRIQYEDKISFFGNEQRKL